MGAVPNVNDMSGPEPDTTPSLVVSGSNGRIAHASLLGTVMLDSLPADLIGLDVRDIFNVHLPPSPSLPGSEYKFDMMSGNWVTQAEANINGEYKRFELRFKPIHLGWISYWYITMKPMVRRSAPLGGLDHFPGFTRAGSNGFILPDSSHSGDTNWDYLSYYKSASASDTCLLVMDKISDDHLFYFLGNIAGHSRDTNLVKLMLDSYLRIYCGDYDRSHPEEFPGMLLSSINTAICADEYNDSLMTSAVLLLETRGNRFWYSSAGHQPMYRHRSSTGQIRISTPDIPLGIKPSRKFKTLEFESMPGDRLLLYTDGLLTSGPESKYTSGHEALEGLLETCSTAESDELVEKLHELVTSTRKPGSGKFPGVTFSVLSFRDFTNSQAPGLRKPN